MKKKRKVKRMITRGQKKTYDKLQKRVTQRAKELERSVSLLRATLESTADGILMVSNEGVIKDYNQKFVNLLKIPKSITVSKDQVLGIKYLLNQIEDPEELVQLMEKMRTYPSEKGDFGELHFKDGRIVERYSEQHRVGDEIVGQVWSFRDITDRKNTEERLRLRERAIEASTHGVVIVKAEPPYKIIYANPAFEKITGYSEKEAIGKGVDFFKGKNLDAAEWKRINHSLKEQKEGEVIFRGLRKDGTCFWSEIHVAPVPNHEGHIKHFVGIVVDITERKKLEEDLLHQATHDLLTDLPNRLLLCDRVKQCIIQAKRDKTIIAILFLDLDFFKLTNENIGRSAGDNLLKIISQKLFKCVRETDTVGRIGDDEFIIISVGHKLPEGAIPLAQKILKEIAKPIMLKETQVNITASIGISVYPMDGANAERLMKNADIAMHQAKEMGRNNFQFYTKQMNTRITERLNLEAAMRRALKNNEFELHYQPLIRLKDKKIVGVEALIRWHDKENLNIEPSVFISFAEEIGLIVPMGEWIFEAACKQAKAWRDAGKDFYIAINISGKQLKHPRFIGMIKETMKKYQIDSKFLELELTESVLMDDSEKTLEIMLELKKLGLKLVIDDFGIGYSSLSYLSRFPVYKLKIDRSFVNKIKSDKVSREIIQTIIAMAKNMDLKVLAEGIETEEQYQFLLQKNCNEGQGFLFYKHMPASKCTPLLPNIS